MTNKIPCSVEILTLNCEKTLGKCLESVKDFDDIIVLDGNSTDSTIEIAVKYKARVVSQKDTDEKNVRIDNFSEVRNKGLELARYPWFTYLDSDEYLSPESVEEIRQITNQRDLGKFVAYRRPRKYVLDGRQIERASTYPSYQLRLFYRSAALGFFKKVHETVKFKAGSMIGTLKNPEYVPLASIDVIKKKWSRYLDMQQESLGGLSLERLVRGIYFNLLKALKYTLKFFWIRLAKSGYPMPAAYEFYNITYHLRLIYRLILNYIRKYDSLG